jgi:hypothetical protein
MLISLIIKSTQVMTVPYVKMTGSLFWHVRVVASLAELVPSKE